MKAKENEQNKQERFVEKAQERGRRIRGR